MNRWIFLLGFVGAASVIGACSSDSSDGGSGASTGGGGSAGCGTQGSGGNTCEAHTQCEMSKCQQQYSAVGDPNGVCKDLIACAAACGCGNQQCQINCASQAFGGPCGQAVQALDTCSQTNCKDVVCGGGQNTGGAGGSIGTGGAAGSGTGGSGTGGSGTGGSGTGGSGTGAGQVVCDVTSSQHVCSYYSGGVSQSQLEMTCMQQGGTVVSSCPTDGLLGCCSVTGGTKLCYYMGSGDASTYETACKQGMGTWSTTP